MNDASRPPVVMTIAGSDSGGGAGIQADLKAFAAAGVHGTCSITAITAQNTVGVDAVYAIPPEAIVAQARSVATDIGVDAVKIGMLGDEATIDAVVEALGELGEVPVVVDPVMVSESGGELLALEARTVLVERILPLATVITPNLPEARALLGETDDGADFDVDAAAAALAGLGPDAVIITGGHTESGADVLFTDGEVTRIEGPTHPDGAAHGSGCTHSSTLAAYLAVGKDLLEAARLARAAAAEAVRLGLKGVGQGAGPVNVLAVGSKP